MKNARLLALAIAVLVVVGGIAAYFLLFQQGTVAVYVKDAPGSWQDVWVTFSAISIHESGQDNATWKPVSNTTMTVDLTKLTNVSQLLGKAPLSPGHYEQIRLTVVNASGLPVGGTQSVTITVPPDNATLKVAGQFVIVAGKTTSITIDINLAASVHDVNGTWEFTPVFATINSGPQ